MFLWIFLTNLGSCCEQVVGGLSSAAQALCQFRLVDWLISQFVCHELKSGIQLDSICLAAAHVENLMPWEIICRPIRVSLDFHLHPCTLLATLLTNPPLAIHTFYLYWNPLYLNLHLFYQNQHLHHFQSHYHVGIATYKPTNCTSPTLTSFISAAYLHRFHSGELTNTHLV